MTSEGQHAGQPPAEATSGGRAAPYGDEGSPSDSDAQGRAASTPPGFPTSYAPPPPAPNGGSPFVVPTVFGQPAPGQPGASPYAYPGHAPVPDPAERTTPPSFPPPATGSARVPGPRPQDRPSSPPPPSSQGRPSSPSAPSPQGAPYPQVRPTPQDGPYPQVRPSPQGGPPPQVGSSAQDRPAPRDQGNPPAWGPQPMPSARGGSPDDPFGRRPESRPEPEPYRPESWRPESEPYRPETPDSEPYRLESRRPEGQPYRAETRRPEGQPYRADDAVEFTGFPPGAPGRARPGTDDPGQRLPAERPSSLADRVVEPPFSHPGQPVRQPGSAFDQARPAFEQPGPPSGQSAVRGGRPGAPEWTDSGLASSAGPAAPPERPGFPERPDSGVPGEGRPAPSAFGGHQRVRVPGATLTGLPDAPPAARDRRAEDAGRPPARIAPPHREDAGAFPRRIDADPGVHPSATPPDRERPSASAPPFGPRDGESSQGFRASGSAQPLGPAQPQGSAPGFHGPGEPPEGRPRPEDQRFRSADQSYGSVAQPYASAAARPVVNRPEPDDEWSGEPSPGFAASSPAPPSSWARRSGDGEQPPSTGPAWGADPSGEPPPFRGVRPPDGAVSPGDSGSSGEARPQSGPGSFRAGNPAASDNRPTTGDPGISGDRRAVGNPGGSGGPIGGAGPDRGGFRAFGPDGPVVDDGPVSGSPRGVAPEINLRPGGLERGPISDLSDGGIQGGGIRGGGPEGDIRGGSPEGGIRGGSPEGHIRGGGPQSGGPQSGAPAPEGGAPRSDGPDGGIRGFVQRVPGASLAASGMPVVAEPRNGAVPQPRDPAERPGAGSVRAFSGSASVPATSRVTPADTDQVPPPGAPQARVYGQPSQPPAAADEEPGDVAYPSSGGPAIAPQAHVAGRASASARVAPPTAEPGGPAKGPFTELTTDVAGRGRPGEGEGQRFYAAAVPPAPARPENDYRPQPENTRSPMGGMFPGPATRPTVTPPDPERQASWPHPNVPESGDPEQGRFDQFSADPSAVAAKPETPHVRMFPVVLGVAIAAVLVVGLGLGIVWLLPRGSDTGGISVKAGDCVKRSGTDAIKTACGTAGAFQVVSIADTKDKCADPRQPYVLNPTKNGQTQVLCLKPSS